MYRCKCGSYMTWNMDYVNGIAVTWYSCPHCGNDTRQQYVWSDHTTSDTTIPTMIYPQVDGITPTVIK